MPELPEVETIRRQLECEILKRTVVQAGSHESEKFRPARDIEGQRFMALRRRGKYLLAELGNETELIVHLGMTGQLLIENPELDVSVVDEYMRAWWLLDDHRTLVFRDVRRFGRIALVKKGDYSQIPTLLHMGPEPFDSNFDGDELWRRARGRRQRIKTQLLGQRLVAGVGNIYADEALFQAGLNPSLRSISRPQAQRLVDAIRAVLSQALERGGTTLRDYRNLVGEGSNQHHLQCYGRAGQKCFTCGSILRARIIDARSTTWCPTCQRR